MSGWPFGPWLFSRFLGRNVPYSGSIRAVVRELGPGEIFGHDELLAHFDRITDLVKHGKGTANVRVPKRYYRVVAAE